MKYVASLQDKIYDIEIKEEGLVAVNGEDHRVDLRRIGELSIYSLLVNNVSYELFIDEVERGEFQVFVNGEVYGVQVQDERSRRLSQAGRSLTAVSGDAVIKAPIPGLVVKVSVAEGDAVEAGQSLIILEAMKMENELRAPRAGVVASIKVQPGDSVNQGQALVTLQ